MVIYEVNLEVNKERADEFLNWLHHHIDEMLELDGFQSAALSEEDSEDNTLRCFTTHYSLNSQQDLDNYFSNHAERMRADGLTRFPNEFKASRRILTCIKRFNSGL